MMNLSDDSMVIIIETDIKKSITMYFRSRYDPDTS